MNKVYEINESDVLLFVTSMGFDLSCYDIFGTLAAGGRTPSDVNSGPFTSNLLDKRRVTSQDVAYIWIIWFPTSLG